MKITATDVTIFREYKAQKQGSGKAADHVLAWENVPLSRGG